MYQGYRPRCSQGYPVLEGYLVVIDQWLLEDRDRPVKQRHTAHRIYSRLVSEHGFSGSESNVRRHVRVAKERLGLSRGKAFLPLSPEVGLEAEVDWGTATVILEGSAVRVKFFCMRSKYSGKHFVSLYPCERQQAFFDGLMKSFNFFGGIFPVLIFDNLTTAVKKVLIGKGRVEQDSFVGFRSYYNFAARFCNPGEGHEKGGVEGLIGYVRRNYLVPLPEGSSLGEINGRLLKECLCYGRHRLSGREETVDELFARERSHLLSVPAHPFANLKVETAKADKYATVVVDKNRYSVPTLYAGRRLRVVLRMDEVEIFDQSRRIAAHPREYGNNKWRLDPDHYLDLLSERPLAFHSARPIRDWKASWPPAMHRLLAHFCLKQGETRGIKDFIEVLTFFRHHPGKEVYAAIEAAFKAGLSGSAGVRHLLLAGSEERPAITPLSSWPTLPPADVSMYGALGDVS
jgi:transposase